jgi:hypothetical protein
MEPFLALVSDPKTGVAAVLAIWLWFERQGRFEERTERQKLQGERDQLLERVLKGLNDSTAALKSVVEAETSSHHVLSSLKDLLLSRRLPND